jgi:hypothetical protein
MDIELKIARPLTATNAQNAQGRTITFKELHHKARQM